MPILNANRFALSPNQRTREPVEPIPTGPAAEPEWYAIAARRANTAMAQSGTPDDRLSN